MVLTRFLRAGLAAIAAAALTSGGFGQVAAHAASPATLNMRVVDARGLPVRDAVISVYPAAGTGGAAIKFPWRLAMAQKDLSFKPGTLIVPKGANVAFPNLDRVRHSVYSFSKPAHFEIDLFGRDQSRSQNFPIAGSVAVGCNIHDTMRGYIRVVDTPFAAKTDTNGQVAISDLPAGAARVVIWHPRARAKDGEMTSNTKLTPGGNVERLQLALRSQ